MASRRSSILKVRQHVDICQEENDDGVLKTNNDRRVSFQNVKHLLHYDKEGGNLLHKSPHREKITDTIDSDGILTPRGRTMETTELSGEQTCQIFQNQMRDCENVDITQRIFNVTNLEERDMEIEVEEFSSPRIQKCQNEEESFADNTRNIFNVTNCEEKEMDIETPQKSFAHQARKTFDDTAVIFKFNDDQNQQKDESVFAVPKLKYESKNMIEANYPSMFDETKDIFNVSNRSLQDMDISVMNGTSNVDTVVASSGAMQISSVIDNKNEESMDIEMEEETKEDTVVLITDENAVGEAEARIDENSGEVESSSGPIYREPVVAETSFGDQSDMVLEETEDDIQLEEDIIESPENKTVSFEQNGTIIIGTTEKEDVGNNTKVVDESLVQITTDENLLKEDSHLSVRSLDELNELNDDFEKSVNVEMEVSSRSVESCRAFAPNVSTMKSVIESPRRLTINSMLISNASLIEHDYRQKRSRRSESMLLDQSTHNKTQDISCVSVISVKRDIFEMNTSVRSSPKVTNTVGMASPVFVSLPNFDRAVSNIVWLTNETNELPDEREEANVMKERVEQAFQTTETAIDKLLEKDEELKPKIDLVQSGRLAKLSRDEKDVVYISRKLAERQLLMMRMNFATEFKEKFESSIEKMKTEMESTSGEEDKALFDSLTHEVESLKSEDFDDINPWKIKKEWQEMKQRKAKLLHETLLERIQRARELVKLRDDTIFQLNIARKKVEDLEKEEKARKMAIKNEVMQIINLRAFN